MNNVTTMPAFQRPEHAMRLKIKAGGFSLVELMVAIALGLLILTAMVLVFTNANSTRAEIDRNNRQIENGRYAIELLRDDVQLAGFYGEMNWGNFIAPSAVPSAPLPGVMPDPCLATLPELTANAPADRGVLRLHVQGVDNYAAGTLGPSAADELLVKDGRRWVSLE